MDIQNAEKAVQDLLPHLKDAQVRLKVHKQRYDVMRKYIAIVLNQRLLDMAILGSSVLRRATCFVNHKPNEYNDRMKETISHSKDVLDAYKLSKKGVEEHMEEFAKEAADENLGEDLRC